MPTPTDSLTTRRYCGTLPTLDGFIEQDLYATPLGLVVENHLCGDLVAIAVFPPDALLGDVMATVIEPSQANIMAVMRAWGRVVGMIAALETVDVQVVCEASL